MRQIGPGALLLALGLACGGLGPPGSGARVRVVRSGTIDPATDARVAEAVGAALRDQGFLVSVHPDPVEGDDPADLARTAARRNGAANAVLLKLSADAARPGALDGTALQVVGLEVGVVNQDPAHPVDPRRFVFATEAADPVDVERRTAEHWAEASGPVAIRQLYTTPEVAALVMSTTPGPLDELAAAEEIRKRERSVEKSVERVLEFERFCADEAQRVRDEGAAEGLTCWGDPCGGASVVGASGGEVILQHSDRTLLFGVPPRERASWSEPPERLTALDPATGAERDLFLAQNLYSLASVVPGGAVATAEWFTADGRGVVGGVDLADGAVRIRRVLPEGEDSTWAAVAPDGSAVASCTDGGACGLGDRPLGEVAAGGWVADGPTLVVQGPDGGLRTLGADGAERGRARVPWELLDVLDAADGRIRVLARERGECRLVSFPADAPDRGDATPMPECLDHLAALPDGRWVGVAGRRLWSWTPGTRDLVPLTGGYTWDERPVVVGDRVVFNRRLERLPKAYDTEIYRRMVCAAPIPAP